MDSDAVRKAIEVRGRQRVDSTIRVLLVDDHETFVDAIRLLLESSGGIEVVGGVTDPAKADDEVGRTAPDIVLAFRATTASTVLTRIRELDDPPKVVILSSSIAVEDVRGALFAGAAGYLTKDGSGHGIVAAIRAVTAGLVVLSGSALTALRIQPSAIQLMLTARQLLLLELVAKGATDGEIAVEMNVSRATLQRELQQCVKDLGARSRTHAAVIAARSGWI